MDIRISLFCEDWLIVGSFLNLLISSYFSMFLLFSVWSKFSVCWSSLLRSLIYFSLLTLIWEFSWINVCFSLWTTNKLFFTFSSSSVSCDLFCNSTMLWFKFWISFPLISVCFSKSRIFPWSLLLAISISFFSFKIPSRLL